MGGSKLRSTDEETPPSQDCRTLDIGLDGFAECPRVGPSACRYAVPFGYCFLCNHPRLINPDQRAGGPLQSQPAL